MVTICPKHSTEEGKRKKDTKGIFLAYPSGWMVVLFAMIENIIMGVGWGRRL